MRIPIGSTEIEREVKRSRFVATSVPLETLEELDLRLSEIVDRKATHNAYACIVGRDKRASDDGEVSGTAGRPILAALEGRELDKILVVVTRYYGGIKLGTGGLVRAYGRAAIEAIEATPMQEVIETSQRQYEVPFARLSLFYHALSQANGQRVREDYHETGARVLVTLPSAEIEALDALLLERSAGTIHAVEEDNV